MVGKGRFQIETSVAVERDESDGVESKVYSTPTLLRYRAGESWEIRLETDGAAYARTRDSATGMTTRNNGFNDISLGVK